MAGAGFFAVDDDQRAPVDFLFAETDVRSFEAYSRFGEELREFKSFDELAADGYKSNSVKLCAPSVHAPLPIRRVALKPPGSAVDLSFRARSRRLIAEVCSAIGFVAVDNQTLEPITPE